MIGVDMLTYLRAAVGITLVIAAVAKLVKPDGTAQFLEDLGVPGGRSRIATLSISSVEASLGVFLIAGVALGLTTVIVAALLLALFAVQLKHYRQGGEDGCRCFGSLDDHMSPLVAVARVLLLVLLSVALAVGEARSGSGGTSDLALLFGAFSGVALLLIFAEIGAVLRFKTGVKLARSIPTQLS